MKISSRTATIIFFSLAILVFLPLWLPLVSRAFGIYIDEPGWYVAKIAVERGKPVSVCRRIFTTPWNILSPPTDDQGDSCVYDFARLTQDPTACELLMPSEYGWSCLGAVKSELWKGLGCGSTKENINCGAYDVFSKNLGISDCTIYGKRVLRDWCHEERTATLKDVYECDEISPDPPGLREACQRRYAFKLKNPALCAEISNVKRRTLCETEIDAWQKYSNGWSFSKQNNDAP
ncbi:MAG: hypothetical protein WC840_05415 [Candidatus Peribacteraceae bacterium]